MADRWTDAEHRILRRYYRTMGGPWVAMVTGRTIKSVNNRAKRTRVSGKIGPRNARIPPEIVTQVRENREGLKQTEWAARLGVSQPRISDIQNRKTYFRVR